MVRAMKMTLQFDSKTIINQKLSLWSSRGLPAAIMYQCMLSTIQHFSVSFPVRFNYAMPDNFSRLSHFYLSTFCCNSLNYFNETVWKFTKRFSLIPHLFSIKLLFNFGSIVIHFTSSWFSIEAINNMFSSNWWSLKVVKFWLVSLHPRIMSKSLFLNS